MKVLILGGHGFVGTALTKALAGTGHTTVPLSRRDGVDLLDARQTKDAFAQIVPDAVVNCAAHGGSLHYVTANAATVFHDNALMTLNMYRAVREVCPNARVINPLSNCSYPGDADVQSESGWLDGAVHSSVVAYGNAKRVVQVTAHCYAMQHKIRSINFLIPNTFGPGDHIDPNKTHALNGMIIRMIKAHRKSEWSFEIWGTGSPVREWTYVTDVADVLRRGLDLTEDLTVPVNIAQHKGYSIKESAELIAKAIGYKGTLTFNPTYQDGAPKKILDDTKFRKLFPDFQFTDHEVGIRNTVEYYQSIL